MTYTFAAITGATSGIGAAFARALPSATNLLISGRNRARLDELRQELLGHGRRVETVLADLSTESGRAKFIAAANALPIDLFVNNAGTARFGPVLDNPPEAENEMTNVNVVAVAGLTRALLPAMLTRAESAGRRAGLIIVASTAAFLPTPYFATYSATKAFDFFYAVALGNELRGRKVDVLALYPGQTDTAFFERAGLKGPPGRRLAADRVAREGLAALGRLPIHIVGANNRINALLSRFMPPRFIAGIIGRRFEHLLAR